MIVTHAQSAFSISRQESFRVAVIIIGVIVGGIVVGPLVGNLATAELGLQDGRPRASDFIVAVPHEHVDHDGATWPAQVTKQPSETSTPATVGTAEAIIPSARL